MTRTKDTLVSILGSSYFQPIANLIEQWKAFRHYRPNKVQSGFYESGYASSVILLLVATFESYVVRLRFVQGVKVPANARTALDVVFAIFPRLRTRALGVNVVPTRVDRRDVLKVFDTIWKTLLIFEAQGRFQCYVSHEMVRFAGEIVPFPNVVGQLRSSL